ncbi:MAG: class IV adenylate cyclase [Candidatus Aenigmatarchaeota archaeon]
MSTKGGIETEVKFRMGSAAEFSERLRKAGAKFVKTGFEMNIKYDRNGELEKKKELLRLRSYAGEADITHKRKAKSGRMGFKTREETVVMIESFDAGKKLLERLGYEKDWIYEKKQQVWVLGKIEVFLDELPLIGNFIEIEGEPEEIEKAARKLGLDMKDALTTTYADEYEAYRKKNKLPVEDLTFREGKG